jgi:glucosylceramidase
VTVNSTSGNITYGIEFYTLGHFSKYVLPGANRVYSSDATGIVTAAFVNPVPNNSRVLVAFNDSSQSQTFEVQWGTQSFTYTLPALAGATFTWTGTQSAGTPAYTLSAKSQISASSFDSTAGQNIPGNYLTWGLETELTSDTDGGYDLGYASDDNNTGTLVASVTVPSTGGWQTWQTTSPASVTGASGVHDLYLVFKAPASGSTGLGNLNWFQFN